MIKTNTVRGLTRETVVALLTNLTSLEMRREEYQRRGMMPEHPRSGTSDDVESYISVLHEMLGDVFDMKSFLDSYPKILNEFCKRINPELPFYYWTGKKTRFSEIALPSFNTPSASGVERLDKVKISTGADPGVFYANRASLPQRGLESVRAQFHKIPEGLPAPPDSW